MSDQGKLVYDFLDALGELVRALGGPKAIGAKLRPELPLEQSAQWVRDCLNVHRREKFDPSQVALLLRSGREAGHHGAMWFLAEDSGYSKPAPQDPADEQAKLVRVIQESTVSLKAAIERLDRLSSGGALRAVK